ncbi:hypothetical protein MMC24_005772 [Lignoscripta atroalba]|nr:hypothetical protein [Lignoscripta atroalba]
MARVPPNVSRILDIGTGPGEWAMAMAEKYPNAEVIATDISIFQPTDVPPNVVFQVDDAEEGWTYTEPFDLIHIRGLSGAFADWPFIYTEAFKHLKQGGILELADCGTVQLREGFTDSYTSIFNGAVQSAAHKAGKLLGLGRLKKSIIESVGFSLMRSTTIEVPLGTWFPDPRKKVVGKMALISVLEGLEAMSLRLLTRETAWKVEDVKDLCAKVQQEILNPETRAFVPVQFVVARKLFDSTGS